MNRIIVILGPTSSGKTSLAVEACKKFGGKIISADSRQIYKHMDIGTGKVPVMSDINIKKQDEIWELDDVKVWGYDLVEPDKYFSAYDFASWALPKAKVLLEEGNNVFLAGGTGFYIDLFTGRVEPSRIPPNFELRKELEKLSLPQLQKKLTSLNLDKYNEIDHNNPVRLIRAIEIELNEKKSPPLPYLVNVEFSYIGLTSSNEFLYNRVDNWAEEIWENGLIKETQNLVDKGFKDSEPLSGLVYKSAVNFIEGKKSKEEALERIKYDLHSYIRRQKTYFDKNKEVTWFDRSNKTFSKKALDNVKFNLDG